MNKRIRELQKLLSNTTFLSRKLRCLQNLVDDLPNKGYVKNSLNENNIVFYEKGSATLSFRFLCSLFHKQINFMGVGR
jgi:hypothetical protein